MDANEVYSFIQTAAGEVGHEQGQMFRDNGRMMVDDGYADYMEKCIKNGMDPQFVGEALADHIYNDVGFLQDMIGDRIYGEPNRDEILDYLDSVGHSALKEAVANLRRD